MVFKKGININQLAYFFIVFFLLIFFLMLLFTPKTPGFSELVGLSKEFVSTELSIYSNIGFVRETQSFVLTSKNSLSFTIPSQVFEETINLSPDSGNITSQKIERKETEFFFSEGSLTKKIKGFIKERKGESVVVLTAKGVLEIFNIVKIFEPGFITLNIILETDPGKQNLSLSYFLDGLGWEGISEAYLGEETLNLKVYANIFNNTYNNYENASLKLISGNPNFSFVSPASPFSGRDFEKAVAGVVEERAGNQELFEIEEKVSLSPNSEKKVLLFEEVLTYNKKYLFETYFSNEFEKRKANITLDFETDRVLPLGNLLVYKEEQFLGSARVFDETGKIKANIGRAFDIFMTQRVSEFSEEEESLAYNVVFTVENKSSSKADVEVVENVFGYDVVSAANFIRESEGRVVFPIKLGAGESKTISFTATKEKFETTRPFR